MYAYFKCLKQQILVPDHPVSRKDILMMKFSNKKNEDLVQKTEEFLFKVPEKRV
jgi:hypothetical protein